MTLVKTLKLKVISKTPGTTFSAPVPDLIFKAENLSVQNFHYRDPIPYFLVLLMFYLSPRSDLMLALDMQHDPEYHIL